MFPRRPVNLARERVLDLAVSEGALFINGGRVVINNVELVDFFNLKRLVALV